MPGHVRSLLDLRSLSSDQVQSLFSRAHSLIQTPEALNYQGQSIALLFFEPSTRTRFSFEAAAHRTGAGALVFENMQGSSLVKGESEKDTVLNVAAMNPLALVIRANDQFPMQEIASQLSIPVLNAGWGTKGHPTQALLDAFTLQQEFKDLNKIRLLFVGDIRHSRVVASHFELLEKLGVEIGLSGPEEFLVDRPGHHLFKRLEEGLEWCDAVMALRVQFERHKNSFAITPEDYRINFGLNRQRLTHLRSKGILMHPGPVNYGIELEEEILHDSRVRILNQVSNGVLIREALVRTILEGRL